MNCSDAKHLIHLDVGNDLRSEEEGQLAEHMTNCSDCRAYRVGMSSAMGALMSLRDTDIALEQKSVWSSVAREIRKRRATPVQARRFNLQIAALSVCSLGLAVVTIVQSLSSMRNSDDSYGNYHVAQPVMNSGQQHESPAPSFHGSPSSLQFKSQADLPAPQMRAQNF